MDEILGGILGVVQALLLVGCVIVILDSFFRTPASPRRDGEFLFLRNFCDVDRRVDDGRDLPRHG